MGKIIKFFAVTFISLVLIIIVGVVLLINVVDPNSFKDKIAEYSYQELGQKVTLKGDLSWSFFPWAGIRAHGLTLANPKGFPQNKPMVEIKEADFRIRLLPLLERKVEVGGLNLRHITVRLIKNKKGSANWNNLVGRGKAITAPHQRDTSLTENSMEKVKHKIAPKELSIAHITIKEGTLIIDDQQKQEKTVFTKMFLSTQSIKHNEPFTINTRFVAHKEGKKSSVAVSSSSLVTLAPNHDFSLNNLHLKLSLLKNDQASSGLLMRIQANAKGNMKDNTLKISDLLLTSQPISLRGALTVTKLSANPTATGTLQVFSCNPQLLAASFGTPVVLHNKNLLTSATFNTDVTANKKAVHLDHIQMTLDQSRISGNLSYSLSPKEKITFNLSGDTIDLNGYMPRKSTQLTQKKASNQSGHRSSSSPFPIPIAGTLSMKQLSVGNTACHNFKSNLYASGNTLKLSSLSTSTFDGKVSGAATVQLGEIPHYNTSLTLSNINLDQLNKEKSRSKVRLRGRATIKAQLAMAGSSNSSIMHTLRGHASFISRNGMINGADLDYYLNKAQNIVNQTASPEKPNRGHTPYMQLSASTKIDRGIMNTQDLLLTGKTFKIAGVGAVNLPKETVNLDLDAQTLNAQHEWTLPIRVIGSMHSPSVKPDYGKIVVRAVKKEITKQIKKSLGDDMGNTVSDIIDNLFQ